MIRCCIIRVCIHVTPWVHEASFSKLIWKNHKIATRCKFWITKPAVSGLLVFLWLLFLFLFRYKVANVKLLLFCKYVCIACWWILSWSPDHTFQIFQLWLDHCVCGAAGLCVRLLGFHLSPFAWWFWVGNSIFSRGTVTVLHRCLGFLRLSSWSGDISICYLRGFCGLCLFIAPTRNQILWALAFDLFFFFVELGSSRGVWLSTVPM